MTEYYTVKRIDNSRLIRPMAPARLKDYWRRVGVGAAMAACLLIYTWQHFECIRLRYEVQKLQADRELALEAHQRLDIQVASLSAPVRVDAIAQGQLGMTVHTPREAVSADSTAVDAMLVSTRLAQPRQ